MNPIINFHQTPSLIAVKSWLTSKGFEVIVDGATQLELRRKKTRLVFEYIEKRNLSPYTCVSVYDDGNSQKFETEEIKLNYINRL